MRELNRTGTERKHMTEHGLLSIKQVARLLYSMGLTFDGLQSTFMATAEFLLTGCQFQGRL